MSNATTIVPIGTFTPALSLRVREMAVARAQLRAVVISMQLTERYWWSALSDLAEALRATTTPYPIRLAHARPRTRALLRELGIRSEWFVEGMHPVARASVLIREDRTVLVNRFAGFHRRRETRSPLRRIRSDRHCPANSD